MILRMFLFKYLNTGLNSGPQTLKCQLPESSSYNIKPKCFRNVAMDNHVWFAHVPSLCPTNGPRG